MNKYISLDTETGGIGSDVSLLTAYFAVLDEGLNITDELYLRCKPDDGIYRVTGRAMMINGIDLAQHDAIAFPYKECKPLLYDFVKRNKGLTHLKPVGQNVKFDIAKVCENIISIESWNQFVSYRALDTATIAGFAIEVGLLPETVNAGLKAMAEYFGVGKQEEFGHDAKEDTLLTIGVYKKLLELFKTNEKRPLP